MESFESKYAEIYEKKTDLLKIFRDVKAAKLLGLKSTADIALCAQDVFLVHNPSSQPLSIF